jgi:hypothetical protein
MRMRASFRAHDHIAVPLALGDCAHEIRGEDVRSRRLSITFLTVPR